MARRRKFLTVAPLVLIVGGMVGMSFAAVPLYQLFCQVTGFGGTTQRADAAPGAVSERVLTVRFNADVGRGMPWQFRPAQGSIEVRVGESALAFYTAENTTDEDLVGTANFNVTPHKVGRYFQKIECFCFTEQRLAAGEQAKMPVTFFIDPAIMDDPNVAEVNTITLSYVFFRAESDDDSARNTAPAEDRIAIADGSTKGGV